MNISNVSAGDVVEVEMRGRIFLARVCEILSKKEDFDLKITPENRNISHYHCNATDVTGHWKKMGRARSTPAASPQPKADAKPAPPKVNPFVAKARAKK